MPGLIPAQDERLLSLSGAEKIKASKTRLVVRIPDPENPGLKLYVKRYLPRSGFKAFLGRCLRSKIFREYHLMQEANSRGIPVPVPLGAAEETRLGAWQKGFLVMREIPNGTDLLLLCARGELLGSRRRKILELAAKTLADAHSKGLVHDDLSAEHILLSQTEEGTRLFFIDLAGGFFVKRLKEWHRVKNLAQIYKSLTHEQVSIAERARFLLEYGVLSGIPRERVHALARRVVSVAELKSTKPDSFWRMLVWLWKNFGPGKDG